ncbi:hypothetical protein EJ02DRAFT_390581 [Clathrospora elynae]|uniref:Uncharacterized protein n=1 Tax=Clathrospora elynae TaxID=706981 RepID=A0A6A5T661_9PLEO|nr:hypothetical protein EJ02DRAFT_390581 [Clathrospora elynae]
MAPRNLLRHIFKHGSYTKARTDESPLKADNLLPKEPGIVATVTAVTSVATLATAAIVTHNAPETPPPHSPTPPRTPEPKTVDVLPEIREESSPESDTETASIVTVLAASGTDTASLTTVFAALNLDINTFTTRDLVYANIDESITAIQAHLETIETMLALLDALNGFSATIKVLKEEMLEKKQMCEDRLGFLESMEAEVTKMLFGDEIERGRGHGRTRALVP